MVMSRSIRSRHRHRDIIPSDHLYIGDKHYSNYAATSPTIRNRESFEISSAAAAAIASGPLTFFERMFCGAIARGVAQTILHPIDVIRTRVQARNVAAGFNASTFVKGLSPQAILALPAGAVQFAAFEASQDWLRTVIPGDGTRELRGFLSGAFATFLAASFRVPQEVLKQRVQADVYPNAIAAFRQTIAKDGFFGLYKGWGATISRDIPWNACSFMFHGLAKKIFYNVNNRDPTAWENIALGSVAGAGAAVLTMPIDVIKTRLMTQAAGANARYVGIMPTLKMIVREEGAMTLMKGLLPRICFLAPLAGVTFSVYEAASKLVKQRKIEAAQKKDLEMVARNTISTTNGLVFASTPVRRPEPTRRKVATVASEADALVFMSAYEIPRLPYFIATI